MKTDRPELDAYYAGFEDDHMRKIVRATLETNNESPRGMVLILASMIDIGLRELLLIPMNQSASTKKLFKAANGPLSTLSSKIDLARSLSLINNQEFKNLNAIRKIRNKFAHELFCSFEDPEVSDRVFSLDYQLGNMDQQKYSPAQWFQMACSALVMNIYHRKEKVRDD